MSGEFDVGKALGAIRTLEEEIRNYHGDEVGQTPWDFRIPTGTDLRSMRELCGLTLSEVEESTRYSARTIEKTEGGHQPPGREQIMTLLRLYKREWPNNER